MNIGIIGTGAIGSYVRQTVLAQGHQVGALFFRAENLAQRAKAFPDTTCVANVDDLPDDLELMIDCAGHTALTRLGPPLLRHGLDLITVSLGAMAVPGLAQSLEEAANDGDSTLHLASGAIGALDCLGAARVGGLDHVTYTGRKPPQGWVGSPAETQLDLANMTGDAQTHFDGSARAAATAYPKNANVAAAVALAGVGFDQTQVKLIADPSISENIHELHASGAFGSFRFEIRGRSLPDNPRSSALAAMSVVSKLQQRSRRVVI